jgi:exodeoxyribonuclease V
MRLLQAFNKKEQVINYNEAMKGWEYSCPICGYVVKVNKAEKCFNHEDLEQDDICGSKYASKQDEDISKKYKRGNDEVSRREYNSDDEEPFDSYYVKVEREEVKKEDIDEVKLISNFTNSQSKVYDMFWEWFDKKDDMTFVISGKAGVGKTYLISKLFEPIKNANLRYAIGTFTGKASDILRQRGIPSKTLHSIMYKPIINKGRIIGWTKEPYLEFDILFIDEFSMLSKDMINDLLAYNIKICFTGDLGQLPAIGEQCNYLQDKVNCELTEIVRQAEGNPIIKWANYVREGNFLYTGIKEKTEQGLFMTVDRRDVEFIEKAKEKCTQVIVGTNKFRHKLNLEYRIKKGMGKKLEVGESLVILKNNKNIGVFNGQIFEVKEIVSEIYKDDMGFNVINIMTEEGKMTLCYDIILNPEFKYDEYMWNNKKKKPKDYEEPVFTNMSYSLTCHKLQGSSSETCLIFANDMWFMKSMAKTVEEGNEMYLKAIYTGITRSVKNCIVVI